MGTICYPTFGRTSTPPGKPATVADLEAARAFLHEMDMVRSEAMTGEWNDEPPDGEA